MDSGYAECHLRHPPEKAAGTDPHPTKPTATAAGPAAVTGILWGTPRLLLTYRPKTLAQHKVPHVCSPEPYAGPVLSFLL